MNGEDMMDELKGDTLRDWRVRESSDGKRILILTFNQGQLAIPTYDEINDPVMIRLQVEGTI